MRYEEPAPMPRDAAERALHSPDPAEACDALLAIALHDSDWRWVQDQCLRSLRHPDEQVRALAVTCLGHVARIHRRLDLDRVLPVLAELQTDPALTGRVEDALDDFDVFLHRPGAGAP